MKEICLKAKSSSGGNYDVTFQYKDSILFVSCSCKAGIYGNLCKHKIRLLTGDKSILYNQDDAPILLKILESIKQSPYGSLFTEYNDLKKQIENEKEKERKLRQYLEKILGEGIPVGDNKL